MSYSYEEESKKLLDYLRVVCEKAEENKNGRSRKRMEIERKMRTQFRAVMEMQTAVANYRYDLIPSGMVKYYVQNYTDMAYLQASIYNITKNKGPNYLLDPHDDDRIITELLKYRRAKDAEAAASAQNDSNALQQSHFKVEKGGKKETTDHLAETARNNFVPPLSKDHPEVAAPILLPTTIPQDVFEPIKIPSNTNSLRKTLESVKQSVTSNVELSQLSKLTSADENPKTSKSDFIQDLANNLSKDASHPQKSTSQPRETNPLMEANIVESISHTNIQSDIDTSAHTPEVATAHDSLVNRTPVKSISTEANIGQQLLDKPSNEPSISPMLRKEKDVNVTKNKSVPSNKSDDYISEQIKENSSTVTKIIDNPVNENPLKDQVLKSINGQVSQIPHPKTAKDSIEPKSPVQNISSNQASSLEHPPVNNLLAATSIFHSQTNLSEFKAISTPQYSHVISGPPSVEPKESKKAQPNESLKNNGKTPNPTTVLPTTTENNANKASILNSSLISTSKRILDLPNSSLPAGPDAGRANEHKPKKRKLESSTVGDEQVVKVPTLSQTETDKMDTLLLADSNSSIEADSKSIVPASIASSAATSKIKESSKSKSSSSNIEHKDNSNLFRSTNMETSKTTITTSILNNLVNVSNSETLREQTTKDSVSSTQKGNSLLDSESPVTDPRKSDKLKDAKDLDVLTQEPLNPSISGLQISPTNVQSRPGNAENQFELTREPDTKVEVPQANSKSIDTKEQLLNPPPNDTSVSNTALLGNLNSSTEERSNISYPASSPVSTTTNILEVKNSAKVDLKES